MFVCLCGVWVGVCVCVCVSVAACSHCNNTTIAGLQLYKKWLQLYCSYTLVLHCIRESCICMLDINTAVLCRTMCVMRNRERWPAVLYRAMVQCKSSWIDWMSWCVLSDMDCCWDACDGIQWIAMLGSRVFMVCGACPKSNCDCCGVLLQGCYAIESARRVNQWWHPR